MFDYYDIPGAAAGQAGSGGPEERELRKVRNMIKVAESTNYDGDPDYYGQIKALALQAGIPIKKFKSNPYRIAKAGLLSMADTALLGLIPNSMYTPHSEGEEMAIAAGTVGGMLLPWGGAGALARGAMGGLKAMPRWSQKLAMRGLGQSGYRRAAQGYQGPGSFFGGGGGSRFMRGGRGGGGGAPVITPEVVRVIRQYIIRNNLNDEDYLFRKVTYRQIQNKIKYFAKKSGIKHNFSFHNFRHYFISELSRQGWTYQKIAKLTGHKSIGTLTTYDHIIADDLRDEALNSIKNL